MAGDDVSKSCGDSYSYSITCSNLREMLYNLTREQTSRKEMEFFIRSSVSHEKITDGVWDKIRYFNHL